MNNIKNISEKSEEDSQIDDNINELNPNIENKLYKDLLNKIKNSPVIVNRLDYYPNSIPLGSFCFAVSFILYGFYETKVHESKDNFLFIVIFLFGGIGQLTAGIFEFIKSRTFPATLYITYGLYFLSFFYGNKNSQSYFTEDAQKIYFSSWAVLAAPLIVYSIRTNIFFLIQNVASVAFFVIKCIGLCVDSSTLLGIVSGILELVAGFCSLYICYGQILNEHFGITILPSIPLKKDNEIDEFIIKRE
jgi:succinate-acetate transporter protein